MPEAADMYDNGGLPYDGGALYAMDQGIDAQFQPPVQQMFPLEYSTIGQSDLAQS